MAYWISSVLLGAVLYPLFRLYLDPPSYLLLQQHNLSHYQVALKPAQIKERLQALLWNLESLLSPQKRGKENKRVSLYNFASLNGGSKIIERSEDLKSPNNLLSDNGDQYMYTECTKKDKYLVLRLSEDILLESFDLFSQEYYSNNIKSIRLSGCINYPCGQWT